MNGSLPEDDENCDRDTGAVRCDRCGWVIAGNRACRCDREVQRADVQEAYRLARRAAWIIGPENPRALDQPGTLARRQRRALRAIKHPDPDVRLWAVRIYEAEAEDVARQRAAIGNRLRRERARRAVRATAETDETRDGDLMVKEYLADPTGRLLIDVADLMADMDRIATTLARKMERGTWVVAPKRDTDAGMVKALPFTEYDAASDTMGTRRPVRALRAAPSLVGGLAFEDWKQTALVGMWEALARRGTQVRSFAPFLHKAARDAVLKQREQWEPPRYVELPSGLRCPVTTVALDEPGTDGQVEAEHASAWQASRDRLDMIAQACRRLSVRERVVLYLRRIGLTLDEIADHVDAPLITVKRAAAAADAALDAAGVKLDADRFRHAVAPVGLLVTPGLLITADLRALFRRSA